MVSYIKSDLAFILKQIKISEAHAAGQPLYGPGGLIPAYNLSWGLRTVDGSNNHLLPGQETWGAADVQFPTLLDPNYRPADGTLFDPDGPGPAPGIPTQSTYAPSNNPGSLVFDKNLRTISNLIVDQTLGNPAAVLEGLNRAGSVTALADLAAITTIYQVFKPSSTAEYQARVIRNDAKTAANALSDGDPITPPTPAEQAALDALAAAVIVHDAALSALDAARVVRDEAVEPYGLVMDGDNVQLLNTSPDGGLSAPFNSWFTLFGQFFDHGLDLVNKGGSGTVFVPLQPDDPLYVPGSNTNFMVLTRATVSPGVDGVMGTADDVRPVNTTTAYVDQNQTYSSHSSHQVFLRQYTLNADGHPVATGKLIEGGGNSPGGVETWGEVKAQALMLGILLTDQDVGNVPLLRTDQYGKFIPNAAGYAQLITGLGTDGIPNTADDVVVSGTPGAPVGLTAAIRIGHAFLADIAHDAVPTGLADGDIEIGLLNPGNVPGVYDNELLDAHFMAGDGRVNENIGLTAVHHVFHAEHNRLVEHTMTVTLADAAAMLSSGSTQAEAVAFLNEWLIDDVTSVPVGTGAVDALVWDGERLFQAAKFGTEMQYQHLVFEEFARKIQPQIDFFVVPDGFDTTINPDIVAEFAHVVYRFGHSMLTETIDRFDTSFTDHDISLIDGFLNPVAFDGPDHAVADGLAAGDIIRGMTRQVGNEIDEFVTSALRNNLLGLPLDLATINLARGRDVGVPSLNAARRDFYAMSNENAFLKPYESWVEFAGNLKNEASIINFVAAYGLHGSITGEATVEGKRAAAMAIIFGVDQAILDDPTTLTKEARVIVVPLDAADFLNSEGAWANLAGGVTTTGLDTIDLWIGGLAEKILPFGGMLGSTFNFVFETQMENLQNGDRFYYLQRLDGLHLFGEMEGNSFGALISRNTDATHLPSDVFSTPGLILEVDPTKQFNDLDGDGALESTDPIGVSILTPLVIRNNPATAGPDTNYLRYTGGEHVVLGGTEGADTIISSEGDDTIFGDGGNDTIDGGAGNDIINAGDGDDVVRDLGGDDNYKLGAGHDVLNTGPGLDLVLAGSGQDFVVLGPDAGSEVFGGEGHGTFDGSPGDNFDEIFAQDGVSGHDVFFGLGGFDEFIAEGGDDIMVGSPGRGKMAGMSGWDWSIYKDNSAGVDADLTRAIVFDENPTPPLNGTQDAYEAVEGLSGSHFSDVLTGSDAVAADRVPLLQGGSEGYLGSRLDAAGIARVAGLQAVLGVGVTSYDAGDIILGGAGSDVITGRGGDDIIDGDKWLNVRISVRENVGPDGGTGAEIATADSMTQLVTRMFNRTFNPGQLLTVREILKDDGIGDIDVAAFSDVRASYDIVYNANGTITVAHNRGTQTDGTDTLRNIERMRFSDVEIGLNLPATGQPVVSDLTPTEGQLLTVNTAAIADPNGLGAFAFQWQSSADGIAWANIVGATAAAFTPDNNAGLLFGDQAGLQLRTVVSFTDGAGSLESVVSAATGPTGVNWTGNGNANTLQGTAGDDIATGGAGNDTLNGNAGADSLNGGADNDTIAGGAGNDTMSGGAGTDTMTGGAGNDQQDGGGGTDTAIFAGAVSNYTIETSGADLVVTDTTGVEGIDTLTNFEILRFSGVNYAQVSGTAGNNANLNGVNGAAGSQLVLGLGGNDTINGGAGNDVILAGAGADTITQTGATGGRDLVDGGAGTDTYVLNGVAGAETFRIYARAAAVAAGITGLAANTEIVITRNGTNNAAIVAELNDIEEINLNALNVTSPGGVLPGGAGANGGDTIQVIGNFNPTSLNFNTITVNGGSTQDTVDISQLDSAHRLVFNTGGGGDNVIGTLRPQDVVANGGADQINRNMKAQVDVKSLLNDDDYVMPDVNWLQTPATDLDAFLGTGRNGTMLNELRMMVHRVEPMSELMGVALFEPWYADHSIDVARDHRFFSPQMNAEHLV